MLPLLWRRLLRAVRVIIALSCLLLQLFVSGLSNPLLLAVFGCYTLYSLTVFLWRELDEAGAGIVLLVDSGVLLIAFTDNGPHFDVACITLYAFVLVTAIIRQDWRWPVSVAALSVVDLNFVQPAHYAVLFPAVTTAGILGSAVALERHFLEERVAHLSRQSVLYRYDAEKARESERQRIGADFHDGPLQSFISFQMRLEIIHKLMSRHDAAAGDELRQLQEYCRNQVQELRAFVRSMRPVDMDGSLTTSLRRAVDQFQKDSGIQASFASTGLVDPSEPEVALELLQIVREALNNVQKHSAATRAAVSIHRIDRILEISIEDNGRGFPFSGTYTLDELESMRKGPSSIKGRVRSLGGQFLLESRPGQGTGLKIRLGT